MTGSGPSSSAGKAIRAVPNTLSCVRLVLAAAFPFAPEEWLLAIVATGGATDFLDGFIARTFNARTRYGALIDGIADKTFVNVVLISLCVRGYLSWWGLVLLVSRDIAVVVLAALVAIIGGWPAFRSLSARFLGKATTVGQFAFMLSALGWPNGAPIILLLAILLSLVAAIDYAQVFAHGYRADARGASPASAPR